MYNAENDPLPPFVAKRAGKAPQSLLNLAKNLAHLEKTGGISDWALNDHKATIAGILEAESFTPAKTARNLANYAALNAAQVGSLALHVAHLITEGNLKRVLLSGPAQMFVDEIHGMSEYAKQARRLQENPGAHLPMMSEVPGELTSIQHAAAMALKTHRQLLDERNDVATKAHMQDVLIPAYAKAFPYLGRHMVNLPSNWNGCTSVGDSFNDESQTTLYAHGTDGSVEMIATLHTEDDAIQFNAAFNRVGVSPVSFDSTPAIVFGGAFGNNTPLVGAELNAANALRAHRELLEVGDMTAVGIHFNRQLLPAFEEAFPYIARHLDHLPWDWNGFTGTGPDYHEGTSTENVLYAHGVNGMMTHITDLASAADATDFSAKFNRIGGHALSRIPRPVPVVSLPTQSGLLTDKLVDLANPLSAQPEAVKEAFMAFGFDGKFYEVCVEGTDSLNQPFRESVQCLSAEAACIEQRKFEHQYPKAFVFSSTIADQVPTGQHFIAAIVELANGNQDLAAQALENKGVTGVLQMVDGATIPRTFDDMRATRAAAVQAEQAEQIRHRAPRMG